MRFAWSKQPTTAVTAPYKAVLEWGRNVQLWTTTILLQHQIETTLQSAVVAIHTVANHDANHDANGASRGHGVDFVRDACIALAQATGPMRR